MITDDGVGEEIFSDYIERFCHTFPAQVCFVLKYDGVMNVLIVFETIFDVLSK